MFLLRQSINRHTRGAHFVVWLQLVEHPVESVLIWTHSRTNSLHTSMLNILTHILQCRSSPPLISWTLRDMNCLSHLCSAAGELSSPAFQFLPPLADSQEPNQRIKRKGEESKEKADQRKVKNPLSNQSDPSKRGWKQGEEEEEDWKEGWGSDADRGDGPKGRSGKEDMTSRLKTGLDKSLCLAVNRQGCVKAAFTQHVWPQRELYTPAWQSSPWHTHLHSLVAVTWAT